MTERKSFPIETLTHNEASQPFILLLACLPSTLEISEGGMYKQLVSAEGNKFYRDEAVRKKHNGK